jgi:nucleoside-diphosphate-sugar epimerase
VHILITGAAGMIGRKLTERLVAGPLHGQAIERLTLTDVLAPAKPAFSGAVEIVTTDLATPGAAEKLVGGRPDIIFHIAGIVSAEAELDFEKGYRSNLDGMLALLEAVRRAGDGYRPKLIFTSSCAAYGAPFPDIIGDDFHLTPLTSYGTQKAMCELLLADYTRRGFVDGVGLRLPAICVRPGKPNKAASGFYSSIIREPLAGRGGGLPHSCGGTRSRPARPPHQPHHARRVLHRGRADRCAAADRRRQGRRPHPPRAGRTGDAHRRRLAAPF